MSQQTCPKRDVATLVARLRKERDDALTDRDAALAERDAAWIDRDVALAERDKALAQCSTVSKERQDLSFLCDVIAADRDALRKECAAKTGVLQKLMSELQQFSSGVSTKQSFADEDLDLDDDDDDDSEAFEDSEDGEAFEDSEDSEDGEAFEDSDDGEAAEVPAPVAAVSAPAAFASAAPLAASAKTFLGLGGQAPFIYEPAVQQSIASELGRGKMTFDLHFDGQVHSFDFVKMIQTTQQGRMYAICEHDQKSSVAFVELDFGILAPYEKAISDKVCDAVDQQKVIKVDIAGVTYRIDGATKTQTRESTGFVRRICVRRCDRMSIDD